MDSFLIPANSKRALLYFNVFNKVDLIIFAVGLGISLLLLLTLNVSEIFWAVIAILPGCIAGFLVLPIPNYHNVRTILTSVYEFLTTRQKYVWKGWCMSDGEEGKK